MVTTERARADTTERRSRAARGAGARVGDRQLVRATLIGAVAAWLLFGAVLLSDGRGLLATDLFGSFYDAQATALLHGHWNVDRAQLSAEAFIIHGKAYEYFGPVPALMRMPIEMITHRFDGRLTRLSLLIAAAVALWALSRLVRRIRELAIGERPLGRAGVIAAGGLVFGLGTSSLLFLAGKAWVFHEDLLWGVALTLWSADFLLAYLAGRTRRAVAGSSVTLGFGPDRMLLAAGAFATLALLTRASVGAGAVAGIVVVALVDAFSVLRRRHDSTIDWRKALAHFGVLLALVAVPVVLYAAVTQAKFGSVLHIPTERQVVSMNDPHRLAAIRANGGSSFGVRYVPSVLLQALRPDGISFQRLFPFVNFPTHRPDVVGGAMFDTVDWSSSLPACEPLLFLLGLVGVAALLRPRWFGVDRRVRSMAVVLVGLLAGVAGFLTIFYIANRYFNDAFPFVALAAIGGFWALVSWLTTPGRRRGRGVIVGAMSIGAVLMLFGAWTNAALALEYNRVLTPGTDQQTRADWIGLQADVDRALFSGPVPRVRQVRTLPTNSRRDDLAIVGDCDALYVSDGSIWQAVESGPTHQAVVHTQRGAGPAGTSETILINGAPGRRNRVVLRSIGKGRAQLDLGVDSRSGVTWLRGTPVQMDPGRDHRVEVTIDPFLHYTEANIDGHETLAGWTPINNVTRLVPGPGFRVEPPSLGVCRKLQARLRGAGQ